MKRLEVHQTDVTSEKLSFENYVQVFDGGLLIHTILSQINIGSSYASIDRTILSALCSGNYREILFFL